jgi:hypoxanthine phosphoribosyltransferase
MNLRYYTWENFDDAVNRTPRPICDGLFPIPRGGLAYALALSHKFGIPILGHPTKKSVFIDDIADSGRTFLQHKIRYGNTPIHVLLRRETLSPIGINAVDTFTEDWIVFPWENKDKAMEDYEQYCLRQRNL